MSLSNYERVGKAVQLLAEGLAPFVDRECRARFGDDWPAAVQRMDTRGGGGAPRRVNPADLQFLLKVMWDEWGTIFGKKLSRSDRNYVSELQDVRNSWAHNEQFSTDDALRALDTAQRLLESVAAGAQANEVGKLHQDLLRQKFDQQMRGTRRKDAPGQLDGQPDTGLPARREVVTPHDEVTTGPVRTERVRRRPAPGGYALFGVDRRWRSGIGMWADVVDQVCSRHERDFLERAERLRLTPGSRRVLISGNSENINRSKELICQNGQRIYIEYSLTRDECINLAYQLLEMFGHSPSDLHFNDDRVNQSNYRTKPAGHRVDNLTGYTLFGVDRRWRSGIDMWVDVVEQVYSRHEHDFLERAGRLRLTPGSRRVLISGNSKNINRSKELICQNGQRIYIEYSLTRDECIKLAYQLLEMFGHPPSDLEIH